MSEFSKELQVTAEFCHDRPTDVFSKHIPMEWVEEAVKQMGRASLRKRRFPAEQAVWLVLGIGLQRNRPIQNVCDNLELAFPDADGELSPMATSSIIKGKERLGSEPMRYLFKTTAEQWEKQSECDEVCGLRLMSVDGTYFKTHNTEENQSFGFVQKGAAFPSVLAVTLMSTSNHLLSDAAFGPVTNSEISYAQQLVGSAPDDSLTLFDRGFMSAELLTSWAGAGRNSHWLIPIKEKARYEITESFSEYDHLIDMPVSPQAQRQAPYLGESWQARLILIPTPQGDIKGFITSCVCPEKYPFEALVKVYWQRWEIERGYGELKQYQLQNKPTLRSKKADGVYQEVWGILTSYNIVRLEMAEIAKQHQVEPLRISFIGALFLIMDEMIWSSNTRTPGAIPKHLKTLRENGKRLILPKKRKRPAYPRAVLNKHKKYPCKKATRS
ncbi:IS4 family transposase [Paraferrimonas sedimenticola]|uniref:IS4 family transposase n=1 Tax=Paraferrimonas sedimenticola TaxID=375674 RepID=A0AA37RYZ8_9GAMM|nr:IS4 family transposase [Paraferrimonas sedimenticola]GLP97352.1 IS4 family transposase [Paraferrimonas sedimenticola]